MSFQLVGLVIDAELGLPTSHTLTLIVLANYLNKTTSLCNPSVSTIARKVGLSTKQTRVILGKLKKLGFISVVKNSLGGAKGETCHYAIHQEKLTATSTFFKEGLANRTTPMSIPPTPPLCVRGTYPTDARNPSRPRAVTPPADGSQTKDKPILTREELNKTYGEDWEFNRDIYLKVGSDFGIKRIPWDVNPKYPQPDNVYLDHIKKSLGI